MRKIWLITGAASGLVREIARAALGANFKDEGAHLGSRQTLSVTPRSTGKVRHEDLH